MSDGYYEALHANEGESYWQPRPNCGTRVAIKMADENFPGVPFHVGMHHMVPGSAIPKHHHEGAHEVIFIHEGEVVAVVQGQRHTLKKGDTLCMAPHTDHQVTNESEQVAQLFWVIGPPDGLVEYFRDIGQPVTDIDQPPVPFSANRTANAKRQS